MRYLLFFLIPNLACAHTGVGEASGFSHGLLHPFSGIDHILAMIAVGVWAVHSRMNISMPLFFVSLMAAGSISGSFGYAELGVLASLLVPGLLIAAAIRLPQSVSLLLIGLFALSHGHLHGAEMPAGVSGVGYMSGFMLSTVMLHLAGMGVASLGHQRVAGALITVLGGAFYMLA